MRRTFAVLVVVVVAGVFAWEFVPIQVMVWVGSFDLTVHIRSESGQPRRVGCEAFGHREDAEEMVARLLPPDSRSRSAIADPFAGQPLTVSVPMSGRQSPFGRELRHSQFQALAVIAEFPNGRRAGQVIGIPDGRVSREVTVTFP